MNDRIRETHQLVEARFGKQFGENKKSTMEDMIKFANEIVTNYSESKRMLETVFLELRLLEELIFPKTIVVDQFPKNAVVDIDAKSRNLIPSDDQFNSGSDTGLNHTQSIDASVKQRYSIKSEPGDIIMQRMKQKHKSMSKSASQIRVRDKLKKDRGAVKKRSKGKHVQFYTK